jgi:gliding motility-associated-like protein
VNPLQQGKTSDPASSQFLLVTPDDGANRLRIQANVPWRDDAYVIFRESAPGSGQFDSIAQTAASYYVDTGLINGQTYCYRVLAKGGYTAGSIFSPLLNTSQEVCATPVDTSSPCAPELNVQYDCEENFLRLEWNDPIAPCPDDVVFYNIYFKENADDPFPDEPFIAGVTETFFQDFDGDLIGCYAVTAVDDADGDPGGMANESDFSNEICLDPCPIIDLPNVFSPNGDNENDFFSIVRDQNGDPQVQNITEFEIQVFNRWGGIVYRSDDLEEFIAVGWDGTDQNSGQACSDGVYFYVCTYRVKSTRDSRQSQLNGNIHLFR